MSMRSPAIGCGTARAGAALLLTLPIDVTAGVGVERLALGHALSSAASVKSEADCAHGRRRKPNTARVSPWSIRLARGSDRRRVARGARMRARAGNSYYASDVAGITLVP
jgi:hypothetical protein